MCGARHRLHLFLSCFLHDRERLEPLHGGWTTTSTSILFIYVCLKLVGISHLINQMSHLQVLRKSSSFFFNFFFLALIVLHSKRKKQSFCFFPSAHLTSLHHTHSSCFILALQISTKGKITCLASCVGHQVLHLKDNPIVVEFGIAFWVIAYITTWFLLSCWFPFSLLSSSADTNNIEQVLAIVQFK